MEKSQKIGIAVAGCGSIAQTRHIPEYMANPHAELIGVYDAVANRAAAVAQANGIRAYDTFEQMLRDESVNAVSICTANRFHAEMTIAALQAGKHVLCEKPMATSIEDAQKMIDASHAAHRNLMIGHNQRLNPIHIRAKSLLQAGAIGRPLFFRTAFMHKGPELWSVDRGRNTWFFNRESAFLGAMCDLGIHKIDLMRWLLNDEFNSVSAMFATQDKRDASGNRIPVEDNAACTLRMHSGILGTLVASWTCYAGEENATTIYGTDGVMRIGDDPTDSIVIQNKNGECLRIQCGALQTNDHQTSSGVIDLFLQEIFEGRAPEISGEEGLAALKVVLACARSATCEKAVGIGENSLRFD